MGDINFIPGPGEDKDNTRSRSRRSDQEVEYTSGESMDAVPASVKPQSTQSSPSIEPKELQKKEKRSFLLWRKQKKQNTDIKDTIPEGSPSDEYITLNPGHVVEPDSSPNLLESQPIVTPPPPVTPVSLPYSPKQKERKKIHHPIAPDPIPEAAVPDFLHDAIQSAPSELSKSIPKQKIKAEQKKPIPELAQPTPPPPSSPPPPVAPHSVHTPGEDHTHSMHVAEKEQKKSSSNKAGHKKHIWFWQKKQSKKQLNLTPFEAIVNLGVNLMPKTASATTGVGGPRNYMNMVLYIGIGSLMIVLSLYAGMEWYRQQLINDTEQLTEELVFVEGEIADLQETQRAALNVHTQLEDTDQVMGGHIYWNPFLEILEKLTLPTVYYDSMTASAVSGRVIFDVVAKDYSMIEPQVEIFKESPHVLHVEVTSATQATFNQQIQENQNTQTGTTPAEGDAVPQHTEDSIDTEDANLATFTMTVDFDPRIFHFIDNLNAASEPIDSITEQ